MRQSVSGLQVVLQVVVGVLVPPVRQAQCTFPLASKVKPRRRRQVMFLLVSKARQLVQRLTVQRLTVPDTQLMEQPTEQQRHRDYHPLLYPRQRMVVLPLHYLVLSHLLTQPLPLLLCQLPVLHLQYHTSRALKAQSQQPPQVQLQVVVFPPLVQELVRPALWLQVQLVSAQVVPAA